MSYILLRRQLLPNPDSTSLPFLELAEYWDTVARTYYRTQQPAASGAPFELMLDDEVDRWVVRAGKVRVVVYAGDGRVNTRNTRGATICTIRPALFNPDRALVTVDKNANPVFPVPDGYVKVFGQMGVPPYDITVRDKNGVVVASGVRKNGQLPLEVFNLDTALAPYQALIKDAAGCESTRQLDVALGAPDGIPYGVVLEKTYTGDDLTGSGSIILYNPVTKAVEYYSYGPDGTGDGYFYDLPAGSFVDGYLLPDEVTFRTWRVTDPPLIDYKDEVLSVTGQPVSLDNLILFNPDSEPEQNGGVLVEVNATDTVVFTLSGVVNGMPIAPQSNNTGSFDGLAAGDYEVDANGLKIPFTLTLDYAPHWLLDYDDIDSVPFRLELWERDYAGPIELICGQANPVVLKSDGLSSTLGGQGDIPPVVGTSAELNLLVPPDTFEQVVIGDDRNCRCDFYRAGQLIFRGYVQPDIFHAPLLDGLQPTGLTATDGLAGLKDTDFLGHIGQRLQGRRPWLNTILHALSRCGIALPLRFFVNRRSTEMSDADAPELAATTERNGYWDNEKKEPQDLRTVVDALAQALGGTLCQREGQWQVRSALEALDTAPGRAYLPAGTAQPAVEALSPSGVVNPPDSEDWFWVEADQAKQVRPAWKSLVGTTDVGWLKNAFPAGQVFSDPYSWVANGSTLRPISGWVPSPAGFPLVLGQGGEKGQDYITKWPWAGSLADERYLASPELPLVAAPESCPAYLSVTARLLPSTYLPTGAATADSPLFGNLRVALVLDGQLPVAPLVVQVPLAANQSAKPSTISLQLPPLPAGTQSAVLYVYPWQAQVVDTSKLTVIQYDPTLAYKAGDIIRYNATVGYVNLFQAKQDINAPVTANAAFLPGALPIGVRPYFATVNTSAGTYVVYNGEYYLAKRDLYIPVPAPPAAPTSNDDWAYTLRADIGDDYWQPIDVNAQRGTLYISEIGIELRPQQATWDGEDNFRADGVAGTVRPTEPLKVVHPDVPIASGLFEGNRHAFSKAVALTDGSLSTAWARKIDLRPSPLFESNVFDALALREGPSRLLTGHIRHRGISPPYLLDSTDLPFDLPGRRFFFGATSWDTKAAIVEASLVEIGPGANAPDPVNELPDGPRITHEVYAYAPGKFTPVVRTTHNGRVRVRHV